MQSSYIANMRVIQLTHTYAQQNTRSRQKLVRSKSNKKLVFKLQVYTHEYTEGIEFKIEIEIITLAMNMHYFYSQERKTRIYLSQTFKL
jgi:ribosomal protein L21E